MVKVKRLRLAITVSAVMLAIPLIAADRPATNKGKTMTATTAKRTAAWKPALPANEYVPLLAIPWLLPRQDVTTSRAAPK